MRSSLALLVVSCVVMLVVTATLGTIYGNLSACVTAAVQGVDNAQCRAPRMPN